VSKEKCYTTPTCNASTPHDDKYKENEPRITAHGASTPPDEKMCVLCGFSQSSATMQLLRKKNLKKNLYRTRILERLGKMLVLLYNFSQLLQYKN